MYYLLILAVGIERLIELFVAKRNARWAFSQGGKEFGHDHYPVMVTLHTALLLGCVIEVWASASALYRLAGLADARRGGSQPGAALVVCDDAGPTLEHPGHRGAERALGTTRSVPVSAPPELCGRRRRGAGVASGAHGMVDSHRLSRLANWLLLTVRIRIENAALGYRMTRRRQCSAPMTRSGADDI